MSDFLAGGRQAGADIIFNVRGLYARHVRIFNGIWSASPVYGVFVSAKNSFLVLGVVHLWARGGGGGGG